MTTLFCHLCCVLVFFFTFNIQVEGCSEVSGWTGWSTCTRTCGTGTKTRSRTCCNGWNIFGWCLFGSRYTDYSSSYCNTQCCAVHGSWSSYGAWNDCPVSCGGTSNNQYRSRYCNTPKPTCGGSSCSGTSKQYQTCNSSPCPVNGGWSEWSKFSACPVTCGGSTNSRTRACDNPTPDHGGNDCVGDSSERAVCNTLDCPDYCGSKPCENGASCANIHYGYKCTCVEGFQGTNCEIDIDDCVSVDCRHGGRCIDKVNDYSCECVPGYAGRHCEQGSNEQEIQTVRT